MPYFGLVDEAKVWVEKAEAKGEDASLPNRLLDARELDISGEFAFDELSKGNYTLEIIIIYGSSPN